MNHERLAIIDGVRTPFCRMGTAFGDTPTDELGRMAVDALFQKTGFDPGLLDEVILGCVGQPFDAANVSRVIALRAGIPETVPAVTVHRNCASGAESVIAAHARLKAGEGSVFLVGGVESMSTYPLAYPHATAKKFAALGRAKTPFQKLRVLAGFRPQDFAPRVALKLGLTDPACGMNMGQTAELVARENNISREEQDAFAAWSHRKTLAARDRLKEEIAPAYVAPNFKEPVLEDIGPREDSTPEKLAKLRPVFERDSGTVTAGNASQITDGAVALLVMGERKAEALGLHPLGYLLAGVNAACDPKRMGLGPVYAMHKAEQVTGLSLHEADLIEINEAFAAQVLACQKLARDEGFCRDALGRHAVLGEISDEVLNVNGGAIALGHPVGASGARIILTALKELKRRNARKALVTACVGGGQGVACWLESAT